MSKPDLADLIRQIEDTPVRYKAIAVEGELTPEKVVAGIRPLIVVPGDAELTPRTGLLRSSRDKVAPVNATLGHVGRLYTQGHLTLLKNPIAVREGDCALFVTQGLRPMVEGAPLHCEQTSCEGDEGGEIYVGDFERLNAKMLSWASALQFDAASVAEDGDKPTA